MGVDPGGVGGGWPVQSSPKKFTIKNFKNEEKINDDSPMRVVNGYYSQNDHQYTHFAISFS